MFSTRNSPMLADELYNFLLSYEAQAEHKALTDFSPFPEQK